MATYIISGLIAIVFAFGIRKIYRNFTSGESDCCGSGGCSGCGGHCHGEDKLK